MTTPPWLAVTQGDAPLIVSVPHTGPDLAGLEPRLVSPWLARKDADWFIDRLYDFAAGLGATVVRTSISRTVIDVNRDPSGASLYPGQPTTELCPTTTFDGEMLYRPDALPSADEIAERRRTFFDPYHDLLRAELGRLRQTHPQVVLYDCHAIRSQVPRLFAGTLPQFNLGTNGGASCDPALASAVESVLDQAGHGFTRVTNGRFRGGQITRGFGQPDAGIHALQMELACRGYLREPLGPVSEADWPPAYNGEFAAPMRAVLQRVLEAALEWVDGRP